MTAMQLSRRLEIKRYTCMSALRDCVARGLLVCLNSRARQSRLYWLSEKGVRAQRELRRSEGKPALVHDVPDIDWERYGFVCFSHRAAIVSVLTEPLQAATIKRRARRRHSGLRMSANNVRDALKLLVRAGIVRRVLVRRWKHPRYELVEGCREFGRLLANARAHL